MELRRVCMIGEEVETEGESDKTVACSGYNYFFVRVGVCCTANRRCRLVFFWGGCANVVYLVV